MRISAGAALLLPLSLAFGADAPPRFDSRAALETFFFPAGEESIFDSMQAVFHLGNPGLLVTAAANAGPEYASKVAATIPSLEFQRQYARLAKYLQLFGPCQWKQKPETEGWWSAYNVDPGEAYCGEATKLVFAATLWSQVHYCHQLSTGEVKPKFGPPPGHEPPYRLDEPPVKTHWLNAGTIYAATDAAISTRFQDVLRKQADLRVDEPLEREAILAAAAELEQRSINRERAGLSLLKMMLRNYEAVHLRHLRRLQEETQSASPPK